MLAVVLPIFSLLLAVAVLLLGNGLLGTVLGLRAGIEGFSAPLTGAVMSAYFGGFVLGSLVLPALIERTGHIRAFAALAAVAAAAAPAYALLPEPLAWMALRLISGICIMGLYMVVESWLNVLATRESRGRIFAAYMSVNLLAITAAQGLLLLAPPHTALPFTLTGMLLALSLVPMALTRLPEPVRVPANPLALTALWRLPHVGLLAALVTGLALGAFWGMGAVYAQAVGLDTSGVASFMAATILGGALLQWPIGHWSDRHDRRRVLAWTALGACLAALGTAFAARLGLVWLASAAFVYGGLSFSLYSLGVALVNDALQPAEVVEGTRGLLLVNGVGSALGPITAGYAMALLGPQAIFLYAAAVLALLAVVALRTRTTVPVGEQGHFVTLARTSPAALELHPEAPPAPVPARVGV